MGDIGRRPSFKTKLPVLSNICVTYLEEKPVKSQLSSPSAFGHLKSVKPWHDPFFYISRGQKSRLAPALPPGPSLPRSSPLTQSTRVLEPLKSVNRLKSLKSLQEPKQILLRVPKKLQRVKRVSHVEKLPQSTPAPSFLSGVRLVNSIEDCLAEDNLALHQRERQVLSHLAETTFHVVNGSINNNKLWNGPNIIEISYINSIVISVHA